MCGLAGFFDVDLAPERRAPALRAMADAIFHRGPDGGDVMSDGPAGLAHRRLAIVDLAGGAQPMEDVEGEIAIVFNGEIFNHVELRAELEARGHVFRSRGSDTEVLLRLWRDRGLDMMPLLNGDFAFALWDRRDRTLVLSRDRMGVRPLHLMRWRGGLAFASEIKALLTLPGVSAELDPVALDQIVATWATLGGRTVFKGVEELEPGCALIARPGSSRIVRWWSPSYPDAADSARAPVAAGLREEATALLADATRIRLRADVPVASYLSGGLDSSLVCALAAREVGAGLRAFSVAFEDAEYDESAHQRALADAIGARTTTVTCGADDLGAMLPAMVEAAERPLLRLAPAPLMALAQATRAGGRVVALTGEGADETFGGYDIFKEAKLRRFCARQPSSRIRPQLLRRLYPYMPRVQAQSPAFLAAFFGIGVDDPADPLFSHLPRVRSTQRARLLYAPQLRAELDGYDPLDEWRARLPADFARWSPLNQAQYLETSHLLPGYLLSAQGDRVAMAHGVEGRFPYLDPRLVDFAARLPDAARLRGLEEKALLRDVARGIVPDQILDRPKQPYRAPDASAVAAARRAGAFGDALSPQRLAQDGVFEPQAAARLLTKAERAGSLGPSDSAALCALVTTALWSRRFRAAPPQRAAEPSDVASVSRLEFA